MTLLKDAHQRTMRKLRISLTDACNFRCTYCMPEHPQFKPKSSWLTALEMKTIVSVLVEYGIEELRLSGGEPTVRDDWKEIVRSLSDFPIKKFGLTSHGYRLKDHLEFLLENHCRYLNISLDSLDAQNFKTITKQDCLVDVMDTIMTAASMDFKLKVNMVVMRGVNDHEIMDFVNFSATHDVEVRFLELMKIGPHHAKFDELFVSAKEMQERIKRHDNLYAEVRPHDSTSYNFRTDQGAQVGFIASESEPFCGDCSRLRLTSEGALRSCLMSTYEQNLKGVAIEHYPDLIRDVIAQKPTGRIESIDQAMHEIGG